MQTVTPKDTELFTKKIKGEDFPTLGFGTYELTGNECSNAVSKALGTGYRHIDTARMYENEAEVGQGMRDSGLDRDEFYVTSKVWWEDLSHETIQSEVDASLKELKTDYLDLVLIHWPNPDYSLQSSIQALKQLKEAGKIKRYGLSNFTPSLFFEAVGYGEIFCNQIEYHPLLGQQRMLDLVRSHDSALIAYAPLGQGALVGYPELKEIGEKYGKSAEQTALRWLIEQDHVLAIPRSSNPKHIESNFDIFDFELDEDDRKKIDLLPKDQRQIDPDFAPDWEDQQST